MKHKSGIAVLEGRWWTESNISVREVFDLISNIKYNSPHNYHYEMFNNSAAFKEIFQRLANQDSIHNIYIASHGDENGIYGTNEELITTTIIKNAFNSASANRGRLDSVYFGSCSFSTPDNFLKILDGQHDIKWIAGYTKDICFLESTFLDGLFWSQYLSEKSAPLKRVESVCNYLKETVPGLIQKLGFTVFAKDQRRTGSAGFINFLSE
jgi:hypothetical protein